MVSHSLPQNQWQAPESIYHKKLRARKSVEAARRWQAARMCQELYKDPEIKPEKLRRLRDHIATFKITADVAAVLLSVLQEVKPAAAAAGTVVPGLGAAAAGAQMAVDFLETLSFYQELKPLADKLYDMQTKCNDHPSCQKMQQLLEEQVHKLHDQVAKIATHCSVRKFLEARADLKEGQDCMRKIESLLGLESAAIGIDLLILGEAQGAQIKAQGAQIKDLDARVAILWSAHQAHNPEPQVLLIILDALQMMATRVCSSCRGSTCPVRRRGGPTDLEDESPGADRRLHHGIPLLQAPLPGLWDAHLS